MKRVLRGARRHSESNFFFFLNQSMFSLASSVDTFYDRHAFPSLTSPHQSLCGYLLRSKPITLSLQCFYFPMYILKLREYKHLACPGLHVDFSKTLMVCILRWIYLVWPILPFYQQYSKEDIFCLIQVWLFLNLSLFDVISHFLPNLFVTGIILDYSIFTWCLKTRGPFHY